MRTTRGLEKKGRDAMAVRLKERGHSVLERERYSNNPPGNIYNITMTY